MRNSFINRRFFQSENSSGIITIACALVAILSSSIIPDNLYSKLWQFRIAEHTITFLIDQGLMSLFFLMIGIDLKAEFVCGEFASKKSRIVPLVAASGGMILPFLIYQIFNYDSSFLGGAGIPIATDIAFPLAIVSLLGKRIPGSLKLFITAFAVFDDIGAIAVIGLFYSKNISVLFLFLAILLMLVLHIFRKKYRFHLVAWIIAGGLLWYLILRSGIHPSISGILLACCLPVIKNRLSCNYCLAQRLVKFLIIPLFALSSACIVISPNSFAQLGESYCIGIILGLVVGKPIGIVVATYALSVSRICDLPPDFKWYHLVGAGLLGGMGFTVSIFISELSFNDPAIVAQAKLSVLIASSIAALLGFFWLHFTCKYSRFRCKKNEVYLISSSPH